jgi:c-di-GMP-binding flagellar brake protein YcgR
MKTPDKETSEMATTTPAVAGIDRRQAPRANAQFDVRYGKGDEFSDAQTCDISATGIGLLGPKQYPMGDEIELRFRPPASDKGDLVTMKAKVRHSSGQRMGLEFVNVPTSDHLRIRDMIKRLVGTAPK